MKIETLKTLKDLGATDKEIMYVELAPFIKTMAGLGGVRIYIASLGAYVWEKEQ